MFNRFTNVRVFKAIKGLKNKIPSPFNLPKKNITATVDSILPTGRLNSYLQKEAFAQQLFKKNQERVKHLVQEFIHMVVHGSKSAYKDAKYLASVTSSKPKNSYTVEEIREVKRIKKDLIKFIPFYAAILIPAGETALLPYCYLFPRAVPSYFMSENAIKEQEYKYIDNQASAHDKLKAYLLAAMQEQGYDISNKNVDDMKNFFNENQDALLENLSTKNMDSEMLKNASDFLMFEYVEGTYILNTMYKTVVNLPRYGINLGMWIARNSYRAVWDHPFFNYNFKMNFFPLEGMKKKLIQHQFERQLKQMRAQNFALVSGFLGDMNEESYLRLGQERGYTAKREEDVKKWLKEDWNPMAQNNMKSEMFTFWYSVIQYGRH